MIPAGIGYTHAHGHGPWVRVWATAVQQSLPAGRTTAVLQFRAFFSVGSAKGVGELSSHARGRGDGELSRTGELPIPPVLD